MKRIAIAAAVAAAALAQPAAAQKWTGFHVAVGGGAVDTDHAASVTAAVVGFDDPIYAGRPFPTGLINLPNLVTYLDADADGRGKVNDTEAFTSIQVGYDYRLNRNFVLGGFASMDTGPQQSDTIKGSGSWQLVEAGGALPVLPVIVTDDGALLIEPLFTTREAT
jgi:opacity protein-like surface antigen